MNKAIGLKRGTVKLKPYTRKWLAAFEKEKKALQKRLGNVIVDIQHVGSTAIPGIHAKPIIDMSAGIRRLKNAKKLVKPLHAMGYKFYKTFQQQILFAKGPDARRTHYLHVMKWNGAKWKTDTIFRNYLLENPSRRNAYTALKKKLAARYPNDRQKYSDGKKQFIKETIRLAEK